MSDWTDSPNVTESIRNAVEYGKKRERERIIKLLEVQRDGMKFDGYGEGVDVLNDAIALIRGEKQ